MKKKIMFFVFAFIAIFLLVPEVNALNRENKEDKTPIVIDGKTFYASAHIYFYNDKNEKRDAMIGDLDIKYDKSKSLITAKIKRSQINGTIETTDTSVNLNIELYIDYHDMDKDEFIMRYNDSSDYYFYEMSGDRLEHNYAEFLSTPVEIYGGDYVAEAMDTFVLFEGSYFIDGGNITDNMTLSTLKGSKELVKIKPKFKFTIEEDVKADMKNVEEYKSWSYDENENVVETNEDITNFYAIYDSMNRESISVLLYDKNGEPVAIDDEIDIKVDSEEKIEELITYFDVDDKNNMQVLSFSYSKFFEGNAKIKVYVGDKFKKEDILTLYYFNPETEKMEVTEQEVNIDKEGYVSFTLKHFSDYVLVDKESKLSSIKNTIDNNIIKKTNDNEGIYITAGIVGVVALTTIIVLIVKKKKRENV